MMVNQEGIPIKTTMDSSTTAVYGGLVIIITIISIMILSTVPMHLIILCVDIDIDFCSWTIFDFDF